VDNYMDIDDALEAALIPDYDPYYKLHNEDKQRVIRVC